MQARKISEHSGGELKQEYTKVKTVREPELTRKRSIGPARERAMFENQNL